MLDRTAPELLLLLLLNRAADIPAAAASARGLPGSSPASGAASRPTVARDNRLAAAADGVGLSAAWMVLLLLGSVPAKSAAAGGAAAGPAVPKLTGWVAMRLVLALETLPLSRRSNLPSAAPNTCAAVGLLLLAGLLSKPLRSVLIVLGLQACRRNLASTLCSALQELHILLLRPCYHAVVPDCVRQRLPLHCSSQAITADT
jgi:hypothetical protein